METLPVLLGSPAGLMSVVSSAGPFAALLVLTLVVEVPLLMLATGSTLMGRTDVFDNHVAHDVDAM